mgnify:CR=1 FL=1
MPIQMELRRIIISEVDRLKSLVDSMLGSHRRPVLQPVNVHEPLERVLSLLQSQSGDSVRFVRDYDLSLPEIQADANQLIQVFLNIGVNALQALGEHPAALQGRMPTLTLRTRVKRTFTIHGQLHRSVIRVDLEDNGPGIPKERHRQIFEPFFTTKKGGTGLGLALSLEVISRHGGKIHLLSPLTSGRGTQFTVELPAT